MTETFSARWVSGSHKRDCLLPTFLPCWAWQTGHQGAQLLGTAGMVFMFVAGRFIGPLGHSLFHWCCCVSLAVCDLFYWCCCVSLAVICSIDVAVFHWLCVTCSIDVAVFHWLWPVLLKLSCFFVCTFVLFHWCCCVMLALICSTDVALFHWCCFVYPSQTQFGTTDSPESNHMNWQPNRKRNYSWYLSLVGGGLNVMIIQSGQGHSKSKSKLGGITSTFHNLS